MSQQEPFKDKVVEVNLVACERWQEFEIHINGDFWRKVHSSIFGKRPAMPSAGGSLHHWEELFFTLEIQCAKNFALRQLARKAQTSMELAQTLRQKLVSEACIVEVLQLVSQLGYLDDTDWLERFIKGQVAKGKGPKAIALKLRAKGIPEEIIESSLTANNAHDQQKGEISRLLATRYNKRNLSDFKERQKVVASLVRRGFEFEEILNALSSK